MTKHDTTPDKPSHTPGTRKGEEWSLYSTEPGRENNTTTARNSTGINAKKRQPIDPRMPNLTPP